MNDIIDETGYENIKTAPAGALDRLLATVIDICLFLLVTYFGNDLFIGEEYFPFLLNDWYIWLGLVLFYSLFFYSEKHATLGMQLARIRLLGENKMDVRLRDLLKRLALNIILPFNFLFLSGKNKQSFADKKTKTMVIKI